MLRRFFKKASISPSNVPDNPELSDKNIDKTSRKTESVNANVNYPARNSNNPIHKKLLQERGLYNPNVVASPTEAKDVKAPDLARKHQALSQKTNFHQSSHSR